MRKQTMIDQKEREGQSDNCMSSGGMALPEPRPPVKPALAINPRLICLISTVRY